MVGIILCFSVVAKIKIAWLGGSSNVLRKALKAAVSIDPRQAGKIPSTKEII